jgi:hypothetical protein
MRGKSVARAMGWPLLPVLSAVVMACAGSGVTNLPSPAATFPGTPGHFDDGQESFDYPADWPVIAHGQDSGGVMYVLAVLGQGSWHDGCVRTENGMSCGADTFDVAPGGVVVKVYRWWGGPAVACRGDSQANATLGVNPVRVRREGNMTSWELRPPGNEFGQSNNIFVEVHTSTPSRLAQAEGLVASFRFTPGGYAGNCDTPTPSSTADM